ncbi:RHOMBOID-like protein 1 [Pyrus communis]|uniref:RHOMBOID-like protein 1 n=1 Tax=Pyrus communis TaxID=23211 RepID=UPI0035C215FC
MTTPRRSFSDYNPLKRWVSWLVPSIVVANIVDFVVTMFVNDCPKNSDTCIGRFLGRLSFQPLAFTLLFVVVRKDGCSRHTESGSSTPGMAADLMYVVTCWSFPRACQYAESFRIGFLYLMSGFGGSLLSALFIQYGISVGASGALFGLLGSMLSELISNWTMYVNKNGLEKALCYRYSLCSTNWSLC